MSSKVGLIAFLVGLIGTPILIAIVRYVLKKVAPLEPLSLPMSIPKTETPEPVMAIDKTPAEKLVSQILTALTELEGIRKANPEAYAAAMRQRVEIQTLARNEALTAAFTAINVLLVSGLHDTPQETRKIAEEAWRAELEAVVSFIESRNPHLLKSLSPEAAQKEDYDSLL